MPSLRVTLASLLSVPLLSLGAHAQGDPASNKPRSMAEIEKDFPPAGAPLFEYVRRTLAIEYCASKHGATMSEVRAAAQRLPLGQLRSTASPRASELLFCYSERQEFFNIQYRLPTDAERKQRIAAIPEGSLTEVASLPTFADAPPLQAQTSQLLETLVSRISLPASYSSLHAHTSSKLFYLGGCGTLDVFDATLTRLHSFELGGCGDTGSVRAVAFSSDGSRIAIGMEKGEILVGDALRTNMSRKSWKICLGHTRLISDLQFSNDGGLIYSNADDGTIRVWNAATCTEERRFRMRGSFAFAFDHADHAYVNDLEKKAISRLSMRDGSTEIVFSAVPSDLSRLFFDKATQTLYIVGQSSGVISFNTKTKSSKTQPRPTGVGQAFEGSSPARISSDGRLFIYVRGFSGATAYVYDTQALPSRILEFELAAERIAAVEFVPNRPNLMIALSRGDIATVWRFSGTQ